VEGPDSSYSCLLIHTSWEVDREARMEPRIQAESLRSGGAMILIFIALGARAGICFRILSAMPGCTVVPPTALCWHTGPYETEIFFLSVGPRKHKPEGFSRTLALGFSCQGSSTPVVLQMHFIKENHRCIGEKKRRAISPKKCPCHTPSAHRSCCAFMVVSSSLIIRRSSLQLVTT